MIRAVHGRAANAAQCRRLSGQGLARRRAGRVHARTRCRAQDSQTVLDVVTHIQRHLEPSLELPLRLPRGHVRLLRDDRQRHGALDLPHARVQGRRSGGELEIAPLSNLPVIKDLATDMSEFFDKWARAKGQFKGTATRHDDFARVEPASPSARRADAGIECIGCGVCYASCDVVTWRPDFLGPGRAQPRLDAGQRRARRRSRRERLRAVAGDAGCHACHTQGSCTERCPKQLAPTPRSPGSSAVTAATAAVRGRSCERRRGRRTQAAAAGTGSASARWCWRCAC